MSDIAVEMIAQGVHARGYRHRRGWLAWAERWRAAAAPVPDCARRALAASGVSFEHAAAGLWQRSHAVCALVVVACLLGVLSPPAWPADATSAQLAALRTQLDTLLARVTERHPDVIALRRRIDALEAQAASSAMVPPAAPAPAAARPAVPAPAPSPKVTPLKATQVTTRFSESVRQPHPVTPARPAPRAEARERRVTHTAPDIATICATPGVLACFDFEGGQPLASRVGERAGQLKPASDGHTEPRIDVDPVVPTGHALRIDYRATDAANHGSFELMLDEFGEGDRMTVQWRQWVSHELVPTFAPDQQVIRPTVGGGSPKQLTINEVGDNRGCSYGEIVANNYYWSGIATLYHGCGLGASPRANAPAGPADPTDYDLQPGGDNVCRYRYVHAVHPSVKYLYPTVPANVLDVNGLGAVVHPRRYHGCLGWRAGQWMTFRLDVRIDYCRVSWESGNDPPAPCAKQGRVRYWIKYADEEKPWLVVNRHMPLRWREGHSGRYGRFRFEAYNTNEVAKHGKPPARTYFDDIVIARNVRGLPWPAY